MFLGSGMNNGIDQFVSGSFARYTRGFQAQVPEIKVVLFEDSNLCTFCLKFYSIILLSIILLFLAGNLIRSPL